MIKTKEDILAALKNTSMVLRDLQDEQWNKQHHQIKTQAPSYIQMKTFVREYVHIDINGKLQPITIKASGYKDNNLIMFLSTSEKFPNEANCQA